MKVQVVRRGNIEDGGHRDGKDAVLCTDGAGALVEDRHYYILNVQLVNAEADGRYVHNRVHGPDFVEMHLLTRKAVGLGFGIGNDAKDLYRQGLGAGTEAAALQDVHYLRQAAMLVVVMVVVIVVMVVMVVVVMVAVEVFHIVVVIVQGQDNVKVAGVYSGLGDTADARGEAVKRKRFKRLFKFGCINSQVKKGGYGHIAAYSGVTFKV